MSSEIEKVNFKIKYLIVKKDLLEKENIHKIQYISLLTELKKLYEILIVYYDKSNDPVLLCQTLTHFANVLSEIISSSSNQINDTELKCTIELLIESIDDCYELNICRSAFVAVGQLYYHLGDYVNAEKYVREAFEDYDYSIDTFRILITILDKQNKFIELLSMMQTYLDMNSGYHDVCNFNDFNVPNIMQSPLKSSYMLLFNSRK